MWLTGGSSAWRFEALLGELLLLLRHFADDQREFDGTLVLAPFQPTLLDFRAGGFALSPRSRLISYLSNGHGSGGCAMFSDGQCRGAPFLQTIVPMAVFFLLCVVRRTV
jgi:hypothetical protein